MNIREFTHIIAAIIILFIITAFPLVSKNSYALVLPSLFFSIIIIVLNVAAKKFTAYLLDSNVEHELWTFRRFGLKPYHHFKKEIPAGIIFPIFFSLFSLGLLKIPTLLTYETRALKTRAAKRFGYYSYTEITDWHNALIGASGILIVLLVSIITYFLPLDLEYLAGIAVFYAFFNLLPLGKFDGMQIFMGSKILYSILAIITLIFSLSALPFYLLNY